MSKEVAKKHGRFGPEPLEGRQWKEGTIFAPLIFYSADREVNSGRPINAEKSSQPPHANVNT